MNNSLQPRIRFLLIVLCVFAFLGAALLWILNLETIIAGPWATVLSVLCTISSVVFAFLQWQMPFSHTVQPAQVPSAFLITQSALFNTPNSLGVNKRRGALVIKARKKDLGVTIHLCSGFTATPLTTDFAANINERESRAGSVFVAFFPALESGKYTVFLQDSSRRTFVTICAGQVAEVDWRKGGSNGRYPH